MLVWFVITEHGVGEDGREYDIAKVESIPTCEDGEFEAAMCPERFCGKRIQYRLWFCSSKQSAESMAARLNEEYLRGYDGWC